MKRISAALLPFGILLVIGAFALYHQRFKDRTYSFFPNNVFWFVVWASLQVIAAYVSGLPHGGVSGFVGPFLVDPTVYSRSSSAVCDPRHGSAHTFLDNGVLNAFGGSPPSTKTT
jgi:hypothetical protein